MNSCSLTHTDLLYIRQNYFSVEKNKQDSLMFASLWLGLVVYSYFESWKKSARNNPER